MPVVSWIAQQLRLEPSEFDKYQWKNRWWDKHLARIRTFTGFDVFREKDAQALTQWLIDEAQNHPSRSKMFAAAINRCRRLRLELPKEKEFRRLVHSAWQQYLDITCRIIIFICQVSRMKCYAFCGKELCQRTLTR